MAHFLVKLERNNDNGLIVREFNKKINSDNPVFVLFQGKASLLLRHNEQFIFFNVRVSPLEPPFYKYLVYAVFRRMLKKRGYVGRVKLCNSSDMEKLLEAYL